MRGRQYKRSQYAMEVAIRELARTSMALQDTYTELRQKSEENETLKAEVQSLKTQILLMQMLMEGTLKKTDEYTP